MRLGRWVAGTVAAAALVCGAVWYFLKPVSVTIERPTRGDAAEIVYASGSVEPRTWAKVAPVVRERIVEQCNCEGARVAQGDVLARLDDSEARAALGELEARESLAKQEFQRLTVLTERNAATQQALDRAQSELSQAEALVAGQKARLDTYILRAPSPGMVLRQDGEVGEVAELGMVLFWVGEPKPLLVVAEVNEEDIPRVAVGQRTLLKADAFPARSLEAIVDSITPKGDPLTKTYRVRARLPDDTPLRIGMSTDVNIVTRVVQNAMVVRSQDIEGDDIFVVEGGAARQRRVQTGIRGASGVEILSGISEDAQIISPYPAGLADGTRVMVREVRD